MRNVEVRESEIQGNGVYSLKDFNKDDVVLEIDDSDVVTEDTQLTEEQFKYHCDYIGNGKVVLMKSPEVYINHSCNPNTYVKTIDGVRKVIAMRDIKKEDEITYDYSINGYNNGEFECNCSSNNCRGTYQGNFFHLPRELQIHYLPYLDTWFVNEHKKELKGLQ